MSGVFDKLRAQLEQETWPDIYFFKFIFPNNSETLALVTQLFSDVSEMTFHESKTGKYISVSVKEVMTSVDSIIAIYEQASTIKGVITL